MGRNTALFLLLPKCHFQWLVLPPHLPSSSWDSAQTFRVQADLLLILQTKSSLNPTIKKDGRSQSFNLTQAAVHLCSSNIPHGKHPNSWTSTQTFTLQIKPRIKEGQTIPWYELDSLKRAYTPITFLRAPHKTSFCCTDAKSWDLNSLIPNSIIYPQEHPTRLTVLKKNTAPNLYIQSCNHPL